MFQELQGENMTVAIIGLAVTGLALVVTVVSTLAGFGYRTLNSRITEVKLDLKNDIKAEERRRNEQVTTALDGVKHELSLIREDIKELRNEPA
jgi:hypothetical protein